MASELYLAKEIDKILEKIDYSRLKGNVGIKVHFGEAGCVTYMNPKIVEAVYDKVVSNGLKAKLIETNVLYRGSRSNATDHRKTALDHGFDFAEIDILDGEDGSEVIEVPVENGIVKSAKLGRGLKNYDSMIVISHFKGHIAAGYGGCFKQLAMGLGSRSGKLHMHATVSPFVDEDSCIGCSACIRGCDFNAIELNDQNKAMIISDKCAGCAMCIAICPVKAVQIPWGTSTNEDLQKKIVDYSGAVFEIIPKENIIFINILEKITRDCDCFGTAQTPLMEDVGILAGYDPVAIDKASIDLAEKAHPGIMKEINDIDKSVQVDYAAEKGLGSKDYDILDLDE